MLSEQCPEQPLTLFVAALVLIGINMHSSATWCRVDVRAHQGPWLQPSLYHKGTVLRSCAEGSRVDSAVKPSSKKRFHMHVSLFKVCLDGFYGSFLSFGFV